MFFSVSTSKRVECYSCVVNFDTVHTMSHVNLIQQKSIFEAPSRGIYLFQFHALAEAGSPVKVQLVVNETPRAFIYDRDVNGANNRYFDKESILKILNFSPSPSASNNLINPIHALCIYGNTGYQVFKWGIYCNILKKSV